MIIVLLLIGLLVLSIGILVLGKVCYHKYDKYRDAVEDYENTHGKREDCWYGSIWRSVDLSELTEQEGKELKKLEKKRDLWNNLEEIFTFDSFLGMVSIILIIVCGIGLISTTCAIIHEHNSYYITKTVTEWTQEKALIEYELEHLDDDIVITGAIYNDLKEFNEKVYEYRYNYNNPWISWFYTKEIAEITPIELSE